MSPRCFSDHFLSIYQSAIAAIAQNPNFARNQTVEDGTLGPHKGLSKGDIVSTAEDLCALRMYGRAEDQSKSLGRSVRDGALLALRYLEAKAKGDSVEADALRGQFNYAEFDPCWIETLDEYFRYFGPSGSRKSIPYRRPGVTTPRIIEVDEPLKLALIGDWGTGSAQAIRIANQIAGMKPDILIHLGDIYYSGTKEECVDNFLKVLDLAFDRANTQLPVLTLSGNHDMYSGGEGYYWLLDNLNDGAIQQRTSYFCLRSKHWQILGLDTGLNDYSPLSVLSGLTFLDKEEEDWHLARISEFRGRTILLSHHQPFSACAPIGPQNENGDHRSYNPRLMASFDKFKQVADANGGEIAAWYWGHEHVFSMYRSYRNVHRGRCLGNGGIPVFTSDKPLEVLPRLEQPAPILRDDVQLGDDGNVLALGFAIVELGLPNGEALARYYQDLGGVTQEIAKESLSDTINDGAKGVEPKTPADQKFFRSKFKSSRKAAFILGNETYGGTIEKLSKSATDADDMRKALTDLEFNTYGGTNFDTQTFKDRFKEFEQEAARAQVIVFYYSGHGIQINGQNYLVSTDTRLETLQTDGADLAVQNLITRMAPVGGRCLVFLDACRDNPFRTAFEPPIQSAKRIVLNEAVPIKDLLTRGLTPVEVAPSTEAFIAFAAEPGKFAYEGEGRNSYFTAALLRHLSVDGLGIDPLMRRASADVKKLTENKQRPWTQSNLTDDFFFKPASWAPMYVLSMAGFLAGLVTSYFAFNWQSARLVENYAAGIPFALVYAFGVWRWGGRNFSGAAYAFAGSTLAWAAGIAILSHVGTFNPNALSSSCDHIDFQNCKLLRDMIGGAIAGTVYIEGCVLAGAITAPSLRRARVLSLALVVGVAVTLVYYAISKFGIIGSSSPSNCFVTNTDRIADFIGGGVWQAVLGAALGYGLTKYIPLYIPIASGTNKHIERGG